jgi:3D (Asp-Asp-Asp) domain-containing protein
MAAVHRNRRQLTTHLMKRLLITLMAGVVAGPSMFAREQSMLARITVYWPSGRGVQCASSNGIKLQNGHCAVDPSKIPYGSKVVFPDAACLAVDSGPAVVSRTAARKCGKTSAQRNALVIDRYFETKAQALDWAAAHPHFMTVQVLDPHHKTVEANLKQLKSGEDSMASSQQSAGGKPSRASQGSAFAPADVRGGLFPTFIGTALPRS